MARARAKLASARVSSSTITKSSTQEGKLREHVSNRANLFQRIEGSRSGVSHVIMLSARCPPLLQAGGWGPGRPLFRKMQANCQRISWFS